jgi:hypothetical protein
MRLVFRHDLHVLRWLKGCLWFAGVILVWPQASLAPYLPVSGPTVLRFQAEPMALNEITAAPLPPPPMTSPAETDFNTALAMIRSNVCVEPSFTGLTATSPLPLETNTSGAAVFNANAPGSEPVSPQQLVPFFEHRLRGTNGASTEVYAPLTFLPPAPVLRSSKATFSTPPARPAQP